MRRKNNWVFLGIAALVIACAQSPEESTEKSDEKAKADSLANCEKPVFDEYKASELAALMRKMDADMRIYREHLLSGKFNNDTLSFDYSAIKTATPTDPTVRGDMFNGMADAFLNNVNSLKNDDQDPKEIFNVAVASCLSCHEQFCPGPMVRIKKLKI